MSMIRQPEVTEVSSWILSNDELRKMKEEYEKYQADLERGDKNALKIQNPPKPLTFTQRKRLEAADTYNAAREKMKANAAKKKANAAKKKAEKKKKKKGGGWGARIKGVFTGSGKKTVQLRL